MSNIIKEFKITNLFNSLNVNLKFDYIENIYIGENGLGKTTILSTLFYTLTKRFSELLEINFESIDIIFNDHIHHHFTKEDLEQYLEAQNYIKRSEARNSLISKINELLVLMYEEGNEDLMTILESKEEHPIEEIHRTQAFRNLKRNIISKTNCSSLAAQRGVMEFIRRIEFVDSPLHHLSKKLDELQKTYEVLYFPTFRRIEEDITKLRNLTKEDDIDREIEYYSPKIKRRFNDYGELIKFGMSDVVKTIENLLEKIRKNSINSFNQMTAILLKQYVNNEIDQANDFSKPDIILSDLQISLDRVGSEIETTYKERIIDLVESGEIYNEINSYLLNFIRNLLTSHEQLQAIDRRIESFVKVCNNYLVNKHYYYDASNVTLQIINNNNGSIIPLKDLSSGEKQIISTFSKIYLEHDKNYIILFDEPELSLSIIWQEMYIPDIIKSGNCNLLICVTHSPYIFKQDKLFDLSKEILNEIEILENNKREGN